MRRKPEALRYVSLNPCSIFILFLFLFEIKIEVEVEVEIEVEVEVEIEVEVEVEVEVETLFPPKHLKKLLQSRALFIYQS